MGKPYSHDLRERVIAPVGSGTRVCAAARLFLVSVSYVSKVVGRQRTTGQTTARLGRAGRKPKLAPHDEAIRGARGGLSGCDAGGTAGLACGRAQGRSQHRLPVEQAEVSQTPTQESRSEPPSRIGRMSPRHATNGVRASLI